MIVALRADHGWRPSFTTLDKEAVMPTLMAPDGTRYRTDDATEIRDLTLGRGYRVLADSDDAALPESAARSDGPDPDDEDADEDEVG